MGSVRAYSKRKRWTESEEAALVEHYAAMPRQSLAALFPDRSIGVVECKANEMGLSRIKKPKRSHDEYLAAKRQSMAQLRARDPVAARAKRNAFHARNRDEQTEKMRTYYARRFFWGRAMKLRGTDRATFRDLAAIWKRQRGLCALTGSKLDRTAEVDHIVPKARGGSDRVENLRWITRRVNIAKRELTDDEFFSLCGEVMAWLGRRIQMVEDIVSGEKDAA